MPPIAKRAVKIRVMRLAHGADLPLPAQQSTGAAGLDLVAAVETEAPVVLPPGARALIPTGLVLELPLGCEGQIRPRSGLALKHGVTVLNSPGTIDSDYRGEVQILLVNLGTEPFEVRRGERIAQLVVASVTKVELVATGSLSRTKRGAGGFGSTSGGTPAKKRNPAKARTAKRNSKKSARVGLRRRSRPAS